ncbi:MAG TPA: FHA domain-containing protein [Candidatus Angelobacter sp.]|nr:FHA domain-containing protein [Candidatus Angelobacter sp.]
MANTDDKPSLKITLEDLEKVNLRQEPVAVAGAGVAPGAARQYGNISTPGAADTPVVDEGKSKIYLQGWFYLGLAGLIGALLGWGICEPWFVDGPPTGWANWIADHAMMPLIIALICLGFGAAESLVERSIRKALWNGFLSILLGLVLGVIFDFIAEIFYTIGLGICYELGVRTHHNPAAWVARGLAWMVFGVAGGIVYGIVDRSGKKVRYGILGGIIGSGLGGMVFDPIAMATHSGAPSRAVGFGLLGMATGVAMGIVESALKDRWLYVASGPLAGKQFILYKPITAIGSSQQCDIYLFKDPSIQQQHARIELRGAQTFLHAQAQIYVSGQPVRSRALQSGDLIQIGRYAFHFRERHRK